MEKQVIFRDRQELQAADHNNSQRHTADSLQHLRQDAVSNGLHFTGGLVSAISSTELNVAPLRFYNDGCAYVSEQDEALNLFQYLPLVTKKCVAVVVWGQEIDTQVEPRDFLIDLTTGTTEPEAVAMQRLRKCNINLLPGSESADPQPPVIQTGTLTIALVYLTPTGVERVEMQDRSRLPNLKNHEQRLTEQENWRALAEPRITSISTDISALANKTVNLARREQLVELANDLARVKAQLNLPASYSSYDSDYFRDAAKTDDNGVGYAALVKQGLLFPCAAQTVGALALFNPYDTAIKRHEHNDLILPAYDSVVRVQTKGYAGDLSVSQYQVQTHELRAYTTTVWDYHVGYNYNYCGLYYNAFWGDKAYYSPITSVSTYGYYTSRSETHYRLEEATTSYKGALIAQTFLNANAMWMTRVGLQFTQIAAQGDVMLVVCECSGGKPDLGKVLTRVTVATGQLKKYPTETVVDVPPVVLDAGARYALVLITQGDHRVAIVAGDNYTEGTLFFSTDGDFFSGDLTKDLMFSIYAAQFRQPRIEVPLQPISLSGGISDLDISAPQIVPAGCELQYEMQIGGKWFPLGDPEHRLSVQPDIVPLRLVLIGTSDLAPAFQVVPQALTASRSAAAFKHFSKVRALAAPSSSIQVQVVAVQWNDVHHTLECALVAGGDTHTPAMTTVRDEPDGQGKRFIYTFTPPAVSEYQIRLSGERAPLSAPYAVIERTDVAL